jgi:hypothetical protein
MLGNLIEHKKKIQQKNPWKINKLATQVEKKRSFLKHILKLQIGNLWNLACIVVDP